MSIEQGGGYNPEKDGQESPIQSPEASLESAESESTNPAKAGRSWLERTKATSGNLLKSYFNLGADPIGSVLGKTLGPALVAVGISSELQGHYMEKLAEHHPELARIPNAETWHHVLSGTVMVLGLSVLAASMERSWSWIKSEREHEQNKNAETA